MYESSSCCYVLDKSHHMCYTGKQDVQQYSYSCHAIEQHKIKTHSICTRQTYILFISIFRVSRLESSTETYTCILLHTVLYCTAETFTISGLQWEVCPAVLCLLHLLSLLIGHVLNEFWSLVPQSLYQLQGMILMTVGELVFQWS